MPPETLKNLGAVHVFVFGVLVADGTECFSHDDWRCMSSCLTGPSRQATVLLGHLSVLQRCAVLIHPGYRPLSDLGCRYCLPFCGSRLLSRWCLSMSRNFHFNIVRLITFSVASASVLSTQEISTYSKVTVMCVYDFL